MVRCMHRNDVHSTRINFEEEIEGGDKRRQRQEKIMNLGFMFQISDKIKMNLFNFLKYLNK